MNVWVQPSDGSAEARQVTMLDGVVDLDSWSPDGRVLAVHQHRPDGNWTMLMVNIAREDLVAEAFVEDERRAEGAVFSPDGRYVAYTSADTGQPEVYIRAYPRSGGRTPVSVGGGREVVWTPTGELFCRNQAGDVSSAARALYDVTRDGRRFLMLQPAIDESQDPLQPRLIVVQNWFEELKRLVPTN